jgi:hypothetical protein
MTRRVSTNVLIGAGTINLCLLTNVKDDWQITDTLADTFLTRMIKSVSEAAMLYCNRVFGAESVEDTFRFSSASNPVPISSPREPLKLTRKPIVSITSVTEGGIALVNGVDYYIDQALSLLFRTNADGTDRVWAASPIVVNYVGGYKLPGQTANVTNAQDLPIGLQDAASRMAYARFVDRNRDPLIKSSIAVGIGSTEYFADTGGGNISTDVLDVLNQYRELAFA